VVVALGILVLATAHRLLRAVETGETSIRTEVEREPAAGSGAVGVEDTAPAAVGR
jgi:hypothetical protein